MGYLAAVVQMTSGADLHANLDQAEQLIVRAAGRGASWIGTPENTNFLGPPAEMVRRAESLQGETCSRFAALAQEHRVHLLLGSFNERTDDPARCANTSALFGPDGSILATYRKIHLFDAALPGGRVHNESAHVLAGNEVVVARTPLGAFGLSICYDLRFPNLYQRLVELGAEILCVPAAFTATTGRDHWEVLLRARAIEAQSYVIAPAQFGKHDAHGARESFGQALIVDPWGRVLARAGDGPGLALAEIDLARIPPIREAIPVRHHRRTDLNEFNNRNIGKT